jgi:hypothetical protein
LELSKFSITKNKLFRIEEFPYKVLEIQVDNRMRDKNYIDITNIIHSLMKNIDKRIVCNKSGIVYTKCQPISFEILYASSKEITFNFAVNELDSLYFKNRLQTILPNSTLTFRDDYIDEFKNSFMYKYKYDRHYMLSLNTKISPIQSLLAIKKDLDCDEKLLLQTIILPIGSGWKVTCEENWKKVRRGQNVTNGINVIDCICHQLDNFIDGCIEIIDDILEFNPRVENVKMNRNIIKEFESDSKTKTNNDGFKIDINSFVKTDNQLQAYNIGKSIETAYKDMASSDIQLVIGKRKVVGDIKRKIPFMNRNIMSSLELANLIKLPDNIMQKRFNIKSVKINQIDIPKECDKGNIKLGNVEFHGVIKNWYIPLDADIGCLPLFILTKMGGGKTTLMLNIVNDTKKSGEGLVLFDYIKNCQTGKALIEMYPDTNVIRFDNIDTLDNFSFPEINIDENSNPFERKIQANIIADEIRYLINSMAVDSEPLKRIMNTYLISACKVVFVYKNQTLKDVLDVLEDKDTRDIFINRCIVDGLYTEQSREIKKLKELDDKVSYGRIQGLLDRLSVVTDQEILCEMLDSKVSRVNFVDIMDNKKPIVILMPEDIFTNRYLKEIICTYYMSRIRLAMKVKKTNNICRIIVDEVHQIPNTMKLIKDTIAEPRKFRIGYVMAMHSFGQVTKEIKEQILDIGCHFMLLKGVSESGFNELKSYIDDFEYEDMKEMNWDYGSLNLINVKNYYHVFMSKLPEPLKNSKGKLFIGD